MMYKKNKKTRNIIHLCLSYHSLAYPLLLYGSLCYLAASPSAIFSGSIAAAVQLVFFKELLKMNKSSLDEALRGIPAFIMAKQVLAKDIRLKVAIQDG